MSNTISLYFEDRIDELKEARDSEEINSAIWREYNHRINRLKKIQKRYEVHKG